VIATRRWLRALLAIVGLAASAPAQAQDISVRGALVDVTVQPDTVKIGAPFTVRIRVRAAKGATVRFPSPPDSADAVEAVDPRFVEEGAGTSSTIDRTAVYRLVAWDIGMRTARFAPVAVTLGGATQEFSVVVPPIVVQTVLPADTTERIPKDVRAPSPEPSGLWRLWFILAVLAIGLAWYFWNHRSHPALVTPQIDAFVTASAAFAALDALALPAAGESARYVIASVDVMRAYLARRFPAALESLTPIELEAALAADGSAVSAPVDRAKLRELLMVDGALRFARGTASVDEAMALGGVARGIVRALQDAYDEQLRIEDRGPQRPKRR
jgi:hypothetical protein